MGSPQRPLRGSRAGELQLRSEPLQRPAQPAGNARPPGSSRVLVCRLSGRSHSGSRRHAGNGGHADRPQGGREHVVSALTLCRRCLLHRATAGRGRDSGGRSITQCSVVAVRLAVPRRAARMQPRPRARDATGDLSDHPAVLRLSVSGLGTKSAEHGAALEGAGPSVADAVLVEGAGHVHVPAIVLTDRDLSSPVSEILTSIRMSSYGGTRSGSRVHPAARRRRTTKRKASSAEPCVRYIRLVCRPPQSASSPAHSSVREVRCTVVFGGLAENPASCSIASSRSAASRLAPPDGLQDAVKKATKITAVTRRTSVRRRATSSQHSS